MIHHGIPRKMSLPNISLFSIKINKWKPITKFLSYSPFPTTIFANILLFALQLPVTTTSSTMMDSLFAAISTLMSPPSPCLPWWFSAVNRWSHWLWCLFCFGLKFAVILDDHFILVRTINAIKSSHLLYGMVPACNAIWTLNFLDYRTQIFFFGKFNWTLIYINQQKIFM